MKYSLLILLNWLGLIAAHGQTVLSLKNDQLELTWQQKGPGWQLTRLAVKKGKSWAVLPKPSGEGTLLFSNEKPAPGAARTFQMNTGGTFPENNYHYQKEQWAESTNAVSLNIAGTPEHFFFSKGKQISKNHLQFEQETPQAIIITDWKFDERFPNDILVSQTLKAKKQGYYSLASPTLAPVTESQLAWATVPGYFQGNAIQKDFVKAYAYGMGVPELPIVYRERCASTLCPLVSTKSGVTISLIPEPGLARDPWAKDHITQTDWFIGLSHKNRKSQLTPTVYYPVLGEAKSALKEGGSIQYGFRYSLITGDWFKAIKHAVYDVYQFKDGLALRQSTQALSNRVERMHHYLTDPVTSLWNIEEYKGLKIGAQSYLGGVVGSNKDAMKNADYGAMWYLAKSTADPELTRNVLPYALNFKIAQQADHGFFKGAIEGQYYLAKSKKFVEEWGEVVEPIAVTYYTMLDIGNMLLFEPANTELREKLKAGAEFLLRTQKPNGSWAVAYDHHTDQEIFKDIPDVRPTFYGLIVAYRILKDPKYLAAARKGADWFLKDAVATGYFLGVCGDARYAPDFATGQSAQALLDLYDLTKDSKYQQGAITTAKIYTSSIYTHPIPSHTTKTVNGTKREDWEIAQSGLSFEHGGIFGSAVRNGPIQLCSHAGMFIRMYQLTKEPIFADMARAGAIGRDAFVDQKTSVASYYWQTMNKGAGPYPHHAWWQIGWITDYLMAEAELRTNGKVNFPRGFVTPKVGPHQTYGFEAGTIYGDKASLFIRENVAKPSSPVIDYILAKSETANRIYVVLLNDRLQTTSFNLELHPEQYKTGAKTKSIKSLTTGKAVSGTTYELSGFGVEVLAIDLE
ncbi:MAG: glycerophosphoryl diester phosphodiesterase [Siphonobacter sp.]